MEYLELITFWGIIKFCIGCIILAITARWVIDILSDN